MCYIFRSVSLSLSLPRIRGREKNERQSHELEQDWVTEERYAVGDDCDFEILAVSQRVLSVCELAERRET